MTVCIAAICQENVVFLAADRMISAELIKYSSLQSKIFKASDVVGDSVAIMVAGNLTLQAEILQRTRQTIAKRERSSRLSVRETLNAYCDAYQQVFFKRMESAVLVPQFLTMKTYEDRQKQHSLDQVLIKEIVGKCEQFEKEYKENEDYLTEALITGTDDEGSHIYTVRFDVESCRTNDGYAAIGIGGWHAESQFMFANYVPAWNYTDAAFLVYKAKKRAEVAEGISPETDLLVILPHREKENASHFVTFSPMRQYGNADKPNAQRHLERGLADARREFYYEDKRVWLYRATGEMGTPQPYVAPHFDVPTIYVSTENDYSPNLDEIVSLVRT